MSCEDFTQYRTFLNTFAYSPDEIWNVKFGSYTIDDSEIVAEAVNWTLQYLTEGQCPTSLVTPIIKNIASEILNKDRKTESKDDFDFKSGSYKAGEVKRLVFELLKEYCSNLSDNVELNKVLALTGHRNDDYAAIYSVASIKNSRRTMEDRYICIDDFNRIFNVQNVNQKVHLYAVFDGHNGYNAACYGASHLPFHIAKDSAYPSNPVEALRRAFIATDRNFVKKNIKSGTTALCALHYPQESKLLIAWVGDSKALLVKKESILQLVIPHKPNIKEEAERIINQGGSIMTWGGSLRVKGLLNLSRALGDICCKPFVISDPDIKCIELDNEEDFLILASDGLWDHLSEEDSALAVYNYIKEMNGGNSVANHLIELAKNSGSTDNITVIVVFLKKPSLIIKSFNNSTVETTETTTKTESSSSTTKMDMDTFDNRYSSDLNLDNTQTLVPNANTEIDIKTGPGKDIFQKDLLFNDGLNNLVDPSEPTSNDTNNPFTATTTTNFDTTNDIIEDKNNIDLLSSFGGESEYHQNNHHHDDDNEILHDYHHHNIDSQKLNNDDNKLLLSSFENDMGPETSVDITDDVMMMTTEYSETTDLLEHSALSHSKETLPSSDNINPFDIKNSLQDYGGNTTEEVQNIEDVPTRTPTSPFEDSSPVPPPIDDIIISDDQNLITNDDNIGDNVIVDEDNEIGILTNKFESMIVNDTKDSEQLIFDDEKDKDVIEKEIIENPENSENSENPSYIQQIIKNENDDEISKEKHFIENNKYNDDHHCIDDRIDKEDVCDKENEYVIDDDYENDDNRIKESETVPVPVTTIQDTLVLEQSENISTTTTKSFGIDDIIDNEMHERQNTHEEEIHGDQYFNNQQDEIDKFNLENKENIEFSKEQFISDQLQHQELELGQEEYCHQIQNQQEEYQQQQSREINDEIHTDEHILLTDDMKAGDLKNAPKEEKILENLITGAESCDESEDEWKYMQLKEGEGEKNKIIRNDDKISLVEEEIYFQQKQNQGEQSVSDNFEVEEIEKNLVKEQHREEEVTVVESTSPVPPRPESAADSILEESNKSQEFEIKEEELDFPQSQQQLSAAINLPSPTDILSENQQLLDSSSIIEDTKTEEISAVHHNQKIEVEEEQEIEDMSKKLNPDAKEFVPSGSLSSSNPLSDDNDDLNVTNESVVNNTTQEPDVKEAVATETKAEHPIVSPSNDSSLLFAAANQRQLSNDDDIVAQSPRKGVVNMENIHLPDEAEFQREIHYRPGESSPHPTNDKVIVVDDMIHDDNVVMNLKETMHADEKETEQISSPISVEEQCIMKGMENADMKESIYVGNKIESNVFEEHRINQINELLIQNTEGIHTLSFNSTENNDQNQVEKEQNKAEEEKAIINDSTESKLAIPSAVETTVHNESLLVTLPIVEEISEKATLEATATMAAAAMVTAAATATAVSRPAKAGITAVDRMVQDKNLKNQNKVPAEGKKTALAKPSHTTTKKPTTTASKVTKTTTLRPETSRPNSAPPRHQTTKTATKPKVETATSNSARQSSTTTATKRTVPVTKTSKLINDQTKAIPPTNTGMSATRNAPIVSKTGLTMKPTSARPLTASKALPASKGATTTAALTTKSTTGANQRVTLTSTNKSTSLTKTTATSPLTSTQRKTEVQKSPATLKIKPLTHTTNKTSSSPSATATTTTKNPPKSASSATRKPATHTLTRPASAPRQRPATGTGTNNLKETKPTTKSAVKSPLSSSSKAVATNGSAEPKLNGSATSDLINQQ